MACVDITIISDSERIVNLKAKQTFLEFPKFEKQSQNYGHRTEKNPEESGNTDFEEKKVLSTLKFRDSVWMSWLVQDIWVIQEIVV